MPIWIRCRLCHPVPVLRNGTYLGTGSSYRSLITVQILSVPSGGSQPLRVRDIWRLSRLSDGGFCQAAAADRSSVWPACARHSRSDSGFFFRQPCLTFPRRPKYLFWSTRIGKIGTYMWLRWNIFGSLLSVPIKNVILCLAIIGIKENFLLIPILKEEKNINVTNFYIRKTLENFQFFFCKRVQGLV